METQLKIYFFTSKSLTGYERAEAEFKKVCERMHLNHEAVYIEDRSWLFAVYEVAGVPFMVLANGNKPIHKAMGLFSETAFESTLHEWGF